MAYKDPGGQCLKLERVIGHCVRGGHSGILRKSVTRKVFNILGWCWPAGCVGWGGGGSVCGVLQQCVLQFGGGGGCLLFLTLRHPLNLRPALPHCHLVVLVALHVKQKCTQREVGTSADQDRPSGTPACCL